MSKRPKKVLVLGSGALKIGEAGEFDYSGSQAIKALREEGIETVLVNPNIATIQTSELLSDNVYFLPVKAEFVERVIEKERPDGILLAFGGQTALNCGVELHRSGVLKKYKIEVLGTPVSSIILTEDRKKFARHLQKIKIPVPPSEAATSVKQAKRVAEGIGYPVMIRAAYALGGQKSGVAFAAAELERIVGSALETSPQVLVEKYLRHFKEIEYEVIRDRESNCVTVCNMENMDPLGIHTGESIVVAPSQTLTNDEYHGLRDASIRIVRSLGIVGECNVQFALNPAGETSRGGKKLEYYVIEVNARLSRSSALASKATGYPLAYVAAKLGLGKLLAEVPNQVTKVTGSFFEPALDYVVVKIPRWDLEKFRGAEERIGSAMKSVGEVMGIGRTFEEALQKAVRMLHGRLEGPTHNHILSDEKNEILKLLKIPTPKRLFVLAKAIKKGVSIDRINKLTGIDKWFLYRVRAIVKAELELEAHKKLNHENLLHLKQLGFSDKRIGYLVGKSELEIRKQRKKMGITPSVFQIDTLAGEMPAQTNYLYMTYNGGHNDVKPLGKKGVAVLGSGPYHIGSSVEFDWSCVHTAAALKKFGKKSIIINCNPETVSTDYDISSRLYFEELSFERVADISDFERQSGTVVSVGGQAANNLAKKLADAGVKILGTKASDIDRAEDRNKFSDLLDKLEIIQPAWKSFTNIEDADEFSQKVQYPVLVRPSYVLSGSAMAVCYNKIQLENFVTKAAAVNGTHPVTVSKYIINAKELELDGVAQNGKIQIMAVSEHVENAGVHSGDATITYPSQKVYVATDHQLRQIARKLAAALNITGPFNIQFLVKDNKVHVIEINLRASRTFPFISKATGVNFADMIVSTFYQKGHPVELSYPEYAVVKSPQFSFARLTGADPLLHVEMSSTGEVACFGDTFEEALLKSIHASLNLNYKKQALLSLGGDVSKKRFLESAQALNQSGFEIYATPTTCEFLRRSGIAAKLVYKLYENKKPNVLDLIHKKKIAFVINLSERNHKPERHFQEHVSDGYLIRRAAVEADIPLFTDLQLSRAFVRALVQYIDKDLNIKSWREYVKSRS